MSWKMIKSKIDFKHFALLLFPVIALLFFFQVCHNSHRSRWGTNKDYLCLFRDSVIKDIDTIMSSSWVKESDVLSYYNFKGKYLISIWEFKDIHSLMLSDCLIHFNRKIKDINIDFLRGEVLDPKCNPAIVIKFNTSFKSKVNVNVDERSTIFKMLSSEKYEGFIGDIYGMSFANELNEDCVQFKYPEKKEPTLFLLYKSVKGIYIVIVESKDNGKYIIDERLLGIFNLN